ncbi:MAG: DUF4340 domain-containing protein, partial [Candidatus Binataceae bacterium]
MQLRKTIIFVVLLAIIGGYAYYLSRQPKPNETPKLYKINAADIQRIDLHYPDRHIVLERSGNNWRITQPIQANADNDTANEIASGIADCEISRTVEKKPADLAPFGLKVPAATVTVTMKDHKVLPVLKVGKRTPVGNDVYVMAGGKPGVLLTGAVLASDVNKTVDQLRSRVLIGFKQSQVNRFTIQHSDGEPSIELARQDDKWWIVKPVRYLADQAEVNQLLGALANAKVNNFVTDNPTDLAEYGLLKPSLIVALYTGTNNAKESLEFGHKATDEYMDYARRGEGDAPVCTVYNYLKKASAKTVLDLRDRTMLGFDKSKVERVEMKGPAGAATLTRATSGKWTAGAEGKSNPAEELVAKSLLDQLTQLKGTSILEDPMTDARPFGLEHPYVTLQLYGKNDATMGSVKLAEMPEQITDTHTGKPATQYKG